MKTFSFFIFVLIFSFFIGTLSTQARFKSTVKTLLIERDFLHSKGNKLIFTPDSNVKKASYSYYYFSKKKVEKLLKQSPLKTKNFYITFRILKTEKTRYIPKNKNLQQPIGGFRITNYYCKAIRAHFTKKVKNFKNRKKTLIINSKYLNRKKAMLEYSPTLRRRSAFKSFYYFSEQQVRKLLKKNPFKVKQFYISFSILKVEKKRFFPKSTLKFQPAYPRGGFRFTYYYCKAHKARIISQKEKQKNKSSRTAKEIR